MAAVLIYCIQVNVLLLLLYLGYLFLLRTLTFYNLNRCYFVFGGLFALSYPFMDIAALFQAHVEPVGELVSLLPLLLPPNPAEVVDVSLQHVILVVLGIGAGLLLVKFLVQLCSLYRIHRNSVAASWRNYLYRNVLFTIAPFSFFNRIYINKEQHEELELQDIFAHEQVHVQGNHTIDILLFEILLMLCWYNPIVWLMRKSVRQNLEFLTDQQVLDAGADRQAYQYALLHVSQQGEALEIANQFNFKLLKNRIMMMNKKRSSRIALSKYMCLIPILIFIAAGFTVSKAENKIVEVVQLAEKTELKHVKEKLNLNVATNSMEEKLVAQEDTSKKITVQGKGSFIGVTMKNSPDSVQIATAVNGQTKKTSIVLRSNSFTEGNEPLFVVNGVRKSKGMDLKEIDPNTIESISILKDKSATETYGEEAQHGVIIITLKGNSDKAGQATFKVQQRVEVDVPAKVDGSPVKSIQIRSLSAGEGQPLMVIDGEKLQSNALEIKDMDPNRIESVMVFKGSDALALYGDSAREGVVVIKTKDGRGVKGDNK